ncbi:hydrogenase maturation peptidase HycI [Shewanella mangrovi]|uniref:hydrogenase maturation peptidase HycI n=1 Tax=Shewanella mangrovi TaxID=1515746 RepID=UPI000690EE3D|nr:hydrogenase maturation peptidase HycI [Shewanella mangrovi]
MTEQTQNTANADNIILCVGNSMMGDDGAGPLLAQKLAADPLDNWLVLDGGSAPETETVRIRELKPKTLLVIDATEMGLNPGEMRVVDPDCISEMMLMSTHSMPLNFLIDDLKDAVTEVVMIGIQPDIVGFCYPMSPAVMDAVTQLEQQLRADTWRAISALIDTSDVL